MTSRIAILCDTQSLWYNANIWRKSRIDYAAMLRVLREGRDVSSATAFVVDRPGIHQFERALAHMGFDTATGLRPNIEEMMEAKMRIIWPEVGTLVIATGQGRYTDVFRDMRAAGRRIELWTFPNDCPAHELVREVDLHRVLDESVLKPEVAGVG